MVAESPDDPLGRQPGEYLWADDEYGYAADIRDRRARILARTWSALYQQRPAPESGDFFKREWLRTVATTPPLGTLRVYGASDYAVTSDGGDYTVHVVVGMDPDGRLWLLDMWRAQASSDVWVEAFCDLVARWKPVGWAEETGQIKAGVGPWLDRRMRERRTYVARQQFPTRGDKAVRAQAIRGRMALDGLHIPAGADWRADLEAELMSFPAGKHDDQVDALGLVGQLLDTMTRGQPAPGAKAPLDRWQRRREASGGESWKTV
jgi:predicted phage terminase large subunit-like protein